MDLKIKDVAELLSVSETTIRRWLADGIIPAYRIQHQYRFNRQEIEAWVMRHKVSGSKEVATFQQEKKAKQTGGGTKQFSLYRALHKGNVLSNIPGKTKEEVIGKAMQIVAQEMHLDAEVLTDLLLDRENLQPTAIGNGIAIPHTRDFLLDASHDRVYLTFPKEPISYEALDGQAVHTLFFLFACEGKRHLHLLAKIAHLCQLPETLKLLKKKPAKESLLETIKEWESQLQKVSTTPGK